MKSTAAVRLLLFRYCLSRCCITEPSPCLQGRLHGRGAGGWRQEEALEDGGDDAEGEQQVDRAGQGGQGARREETLQERPGRGRRCGGWRRHGEQLIELFTMPACSWWSPGSQPRVGMDVLCQCWTSLWTTPPQVLGGLFLCSSWF